MKDKSKLLNYIPVKDCESVDEGGIVTLSFRKKNPSFIDKLFFKKLLAKPYKIDLDYIGSFVWKQIDGKKTVSELVQISRGYFGEKIEPADQRVVKFIEQLNGAKFIRLFDKR